MITWKDFSNIRIFRSIRMKAGAVITAEAADGSSTSISVAELAALNDLGAADLAKIDGITNGTSAASKALVLDANSGINAFREAGRNLRKQAAPAAKTTTTTLTIAELLAGLLTADQGAAGAATYTLPIGSDIETGLLAAYPGLQTDDSFDFTVVNISTVAAEDVTVVGDTGTTLVGSGDIASNAAATDKSTGTFRVRRTAADTYSVYRL